MSFPKNPAVGEIYIDLSNGSTWIYEGDIARWVMFSGLQDPVTFREEAYDEEDDNLSQTVELLRDLVESYKTEIEGLKDQVKRHETDQQYSKMAYDVAYVKCLQEELKRLNSNHTLLTPAVRDYSAAPTEYVVETYQVPLKRTDALGFEQAVDHRTYTKNIHLLFRSGETVFRHSIDSMQLMMMNGDPVKAAEMTFDAMAEALKGSFIRSVTQNSGNGY